MNQRDYQSPIRPGRIVKAAAFAGFGLGVDRLAGRRSSGSIVTVETPSGPQRRRPRSTRFPAKVTGSGNPYNFVEVQPIKGGQWMTLVGGRSGSNLYEMNSKSIPSNSVVDVVSVGDGSWFRCLWKSKLGGGVNVNLQISYPCAPTCSNPTLIPYAGQPVSVFNGSTAVFSGTTDSLGKVTATGVPTSGTNKVVVSDPRYLPYTLGSPFFALPFDNSIYTCMPFGCPNPVKRLMTVLINGVSHTWTYFADPRYSQFGWSDGGHGVSGSSGIADSNAVYTSASSCVYQGFVNYPGARETFGATITSCNPFAMTFSFSDSTTGSMSESP